MAWSLKFLSIFTTFLFVCGSVSGQDIALADFEGNSHFSFKISDETLTIPGCPEPNAVFLERVNESTIRIEWADVKADPYDTRYQIRMRKKGERETFDNWKYLWVYEGNFVTLDGLQEDKLYEFEIRKLCGGSLENYELSSEWVPVGKWERGGGGEEEICNNFSGAEIVINNDGTFILYFPPSIADSLILLGYNFLISYQDCETSVWYYDIVYPFHSFSYDSDSVRVGVGGGGSDAGGTSVTSICGLKINITDEDPFQGPPDGGVSYVSGSETTQVLCNWITLLENDPSSTIVTTCGEEYEPKELSETQYSGTLNEGDTVYAVGFPIIIIDTNPLTGKITLPFQNKIALVSIDPDYLNEDLWLYTGSLEFLSGDSIPWPEPNLVTPGEQCRENEDNGTWEDGINSETDTIWDPNGFGSDGTYTKQPPYPGYQPGDTVDLNYDPCGFDVNGIHVITGTIYNEDGCSRDLIDSINGSPCILNCIPYYWLKENGGQTPEGNEFYNEIRDSLEYNVLGIISDLYDEQDSIKDDQASECNAIASSMRTIVSSESLDSTYVFGENSEYINPGLSEKFTSAPQPMHQQGVPRNPNIKSLEQKHIELYECDLELQLKLDIVDLLDDLEQQQVDRDALLAYLENIIKSFSASEVSNYQSNPSAWTQKLKELILQYVESYVNSINGIGYIDGEQIDQGNVLLDNSFKSPNHFFNEQDLSEFVRLVNSNSELSSAVLGGGPDPDNNLLPIEISKEINGKKYSIVITRILLTPEYGELDAFLRLYLPNSAEEIIFGGKNIQFTPEGLKEAELFLGSQVRAVKINNVASLVLNPDSTYVKWGCNGFESLSIDGFIEFCSNFLLPIDSTTEEAIQNPDSSQLVKAHFLTNFNKFDGFWAELDMDPFVINGAEHIKWQVQGAVLDLSDKISPNVEFPAGYATAFHTGKKPANLWKGFYLDSLTATITEFQDTSENPLVIGVNDLIIDDKGVSGEIFVETEVLPLSKGNLSGWAFSIEKLEILIIGNQVMGGGFGGLVHIPLFKKNQNSDTIYVEDCFEYSAEIRRGGDFNFIITPKDTMPVPAFGAQIELDSTSFLNVSKVNSNYKVEAKLDGRLKFESSVFNSTEEITFHNVRIRNTPNYFSPGNWSVPKFNLEFSVFKFNVDKFRFDTIPADSLRSKLVIQAGVEINSDFMLSAYGDLDINIKLDKVNNRQIWKNESIKLNKLKIAQDIQGTYVDGSLQFFDEEDSTSTQGFGKGFQADLEVWFKGMNNDAAQGENSKPTTSGFRASGIFGEVDDYNYFNVDVLVKFKNGINVFGPLSLNAIGGGLSYHMDRVSDLITLPSSDSIPDNSPVAEVFLPLGESISGIQYEPNDSIGIGVKLVVAGTIKDENICSVNAGFEIMFTSATSGEGASIDKIGIWGQAELMSNLDITKVPGFPEELLGAIESTSIISEDDLDILTSPNVSAQISAYVSLELNVTDGYLDGNFALFLEAGNPQNPILYGRALAELYISKEDWFFNVGRLRSNKDGRVELTLDLAIAEVMAKAYLNIGTGIPPLPPPPKQIQDLFGNVSSPDAALGNGTGFAFGVAVGVSVDINFFIGKIHMDAGFGFDLAIKQYKDALCANTNDELGINGWYASGQAYLYLNGDVRLFGAKLLDISTGVLVQAGFPNPSWVEGRMKLKYKLLFVRGSITAKFKFGERCEMSGYSESLPDVIFSVSPYEGSHGVNVFTSLYVDFNIPMDTIFTYTQNGTPVEYRTFIDTLKLTTSFGLEIPFKKEYSEDNLRLTITPNYVLPSGDSLTFTIKTKIFKDTVEFTNADGLERVVIFHTTGQLEHLPKANIVAEYPVNGMANFYPKEYVKQEGYVLLERNIYDLSSASHVAIALITRPDTSFNSHPDSSYHISPIQYSVLNRRMSYSLPSDILLNGKYYKVDFCLVDPNNFDIPTNVIPLTNFNLSDFKSFYSSVFRVSNYNTVNEKLDIVQDSADLDLEFESNLYSSCVAIPLPLNEAFDASEFQQVFTDWNALPDFHEGGKLFKVTLSINSRSSSSVQSTLNSIYGPVLDDYVRPFDENTFSINYGYSFTQSGDSYDVFRKSVGIGSSCSNSYLNILQNHLEEDDVSGLLALENEESQGGGTLYSGFEGGNPGNNGIDSSLIGSQFLRIYSVSMIPSLIDYSRRAAKSVEHRYLSFCMQDPDNDPLTGSGNHGNGLRIPDPDDCDVAIVLGRIHDLTLENSLTEYPTPPTSVVLPIKFTYTLPGLNLPPTTERVIEVSISESN